MELLVPKSQGDSVKQGGQVNSCKFKARTDTVLLGLDNFQKSVDDLFRQWAKAGVMRLDIAVLLNRLLDQGMEISVKKLCWSLLWRG